MAINRFLIILAAASLLVPDSCGAHNYHREILAAVLAVSPATWLALAAVALGLFAVTRPGMIPELRS